MGKLDELKGKAKAVGDNITDDVEEKKREADKRTTDEAEGYAEARDR